MGRGRCAQCPTIASNDQLHLQMKVQSVGCGMLWNLGLHYASFCLILECQCKRERELKSDENWAQPFCHWIHLEYNDTNIDLQCKNPIVFFPILTTPPKTAINNKPDIAIRVGRRFHFFLWLLIVSHNKYLWILIRMLPPYFLMNQKWCFMICQ